MRCLSTLLVLCLVALVTAAARAENEGQADLDKATELQIAAETLGELEQVIKLAESALAKGLDKGQTEFAKKMLGATLYQHAERAAKWKAEAKAGLAAAAASPPCVNPFLRRRCGSI